MKSLIFVLLTLICASAACVTQPVLSDEGSAIRLMTNAEPDCPEVGHVTTNSHWFREPNDVNVYLRNEAATNYDANVVLRDTLVLEDNLYSGTGKVFRCEDVEDKS